MSQHHKRVGWASISQTLRPRIAASLPAQCIRCGGIITRDMKWDVGHRVDLEMPGANPYDVGPEHARCNRRAGGRAGARKVNARRAARDPRDERMPAW